MSIPASPPEGQGWRQVLRFVINGVMATLVHFLALTFNLEVLGMRSAGVANLLAAAVGIMASFLGSRYYVFPGSQERIVVQAAKFAALYASIAVLHGGVLFVWTDLAGLDYRAGFVLATGLQALLSYAGNKRLVFNR